MKYILLIAAFITMIFSFGCNNNVNEKTSYLQKIEIENNISYDQILNTRGSYITSMCYTMTQDESLESVSNPCYSCHTKGIIPNYYNDSPLQESYNFPPEMMKNPFSNLFKDRSIRVSQISDEEIWTYVRQSNYIDEKGNILLADRLPKDWEGYIPDCYFNFDSEGFDRDINGNYTLWRAFRYYPFLGTFWPTNGSMDDVLIRLDQNFAMSEDGQLDIEVYKLNLAIVESVVKQKDINLSVTVDEVQYGVDLNQNGILDSSSIVVVATYDQMSYVGMAKKLLEEKKIHLALGLYPENTEFLHSVRYIDWDENLGRIVLSKRMKELRYAKKYEWNSYSAIARTALTETKEAIVNGTDEAVLATFRGDYEYGLNNEIGWIYQGFIEDKNGLLRPQTHEETINCMGCHSHLGSTTDSTFAFARKFEGIDPDANDYGWNHWTQKGLKGIKEPLISYFNYGEQYEYSFYLQNNHSGNEFRNNQEVQEKFFHSDGSVKQDMLEALHQDISLLLFPSKERALELNKGYKTLVEEQSFIYGRDANVLPMENVYTKIQAEQSTQIEQVIVR